MSAKPTIIIVFFFSLILFSSCQFKSVLDKTFDLKLYTHHFTQMQDLKDITRDDLFLINYTIVRQRDYYNYQIEGKTYREILEMGKSFRANGLPVKEQYNRNGEQEALKLKADAEGIGMIRKGENSSRLKKVLNFNCTFENTNDKDVVIASASFILKGPFNDHLSTVGYELNCIVNEGQKIEILFVADATNITKNLLHKRPFKAPYIGIDDILNNMEVEIGGATVEFQTADFEDCMHYSTRIAPHIALDYQKDLEDKDWQIKDSSGQVTTLNLGETHFIIEYSDEPVKASDFQ